VNKKRESLALMGYSLEDYIKMFSLHEDELTMNILDCYAGVNSFAAEMAIKQGKVIAWDPLYELPVTDIERLSKTAQLAVMKDMQAHPERYRTPDLNHFQIQHEKNRQQLLQDLPLGLQQRRYHVAAFPHLSFADESFDLALINHFLFRQNHSPALDFHKLVIKELIRIANEIRIFPLVTTQSTLSPLIGEVIEYCQQENLGVELRHVDYELQKQGNALLRIWKPSCTVAAHH